MSILLWVNHTHRRKKMKYFANDAFPSTKGVYLIGFIGSNKVYVGSACAEGEFNCHQGFRARWNSHIIMLEKNSGKKRKLQNAYNKYGKNNIYFEILEICDRSTCFDKEQLWINTYDSIRNGYNACNVGEFPECAKDEEAIRKNEEKLKEKKDFLKNEILKLYNEGMSNNEISNILKINKKTTSKYLKEEGLKNKNGWFNRAENVFCYYIKDGKVELFKSVLQCAEKLGLDKNMIHQVLGPKGLRTHKDYSFSREELTVEQFEEKIKKRSKWDNKNDD